MSIELKCPNCGHQLRISSRYAGKRGVCKHCKGDVDVPPASVQAVAPIRGEAFAPDDELVLDDAPALRGLAAAGMSEADAKSLENLNIDDNWQPPPPVSAPGSAVGGEKRLGVIFWLVLAIFTPAALIWAILLPSGHSQKRMAVIASVLVFVVAPILIIGIFIVLPLALPAIRVAMSPDRFVPGEVRIFDDIEFVWIPAGTFTMGSPSSEKSREDDEREHQVTIRQGFWLGRYEVTQREWRRVMGSNPSRFKDDDCPVETVSWNDAQLFLGNLDASNSGAYRLPTEAEWEYACRAGTTGPFHYGNSLSSDQANFQGNRPYGGAREGTDRKKTTSVGSFRPNAWGLYDMHGNVWEWCQDWYEGDPNVIVTDMKGTRLRFRVLRGGSWGHVAHRARSANRRKFTPDVRYQTLGFRVVRTQT